MAKAKKRNYSAADSRVEILREDAKYYRTAYKEELLRRTQLETALRDFYSLLRECAGE